MQKFQVDDDVELLASSYEDSGYFPGDKGKVIDTREGRFDQDIRIEWRDTSKPDCWMAAEDFVPYG